MKRLISLLLCITIVFSLFSGLDISVFATRESAETQLIDIDIYKAQCLAGIAGDPNSDAVERCNALYNYYINEKVHSPTQTFLDECYNDESLMDDYAEWTAYSLAASPSSALDCVMKKEDYYETLIIAMYSQALTKDGEWEKLINNKIVNDTTSMLNELCNVLQLSQASQLDEILDLSDPKTFEYVTDTVEKYYPVGTAGKVLGVVGTALEYGKNITDVCQRISAYNAMVELDNSAKLWLNQMYSSCGENTDPSLKAALLDLKSASTGFAQAALVDIKEASFSIANWGIKVVMDYGVAQLASLNPITASVVVGLQAGKTICNVFFATDDVCEQLFLMECIYDVQGLSRTVADDCKNTFINSQTKDNALSFNFAVDCYFESIINVDIDCIINFLDLLYNSGLLKGTIVWMYGATDDYQEAVNVLESLRDVRQNNYGMMIAYFKAALHANYPDTYNYYFTVDDTIPITDISFLTSRILPPPYPVGYANMIVGDFANIDVQYVPSNTTQRAYTVTSDNPDVVEINDNVMTAVSAGTANVTVTSVENPDVSYTTEIKVGEKLEDTEIEELTTWFTYTVNENGEATITGLVDGYEPTKLTIPNRIKGYPVIAIGKNAFYDRNFITNVKISSSIDTIGSSAFASCNYLTDVIISDGVKNVGDSAFAYCGRLVNLLMGDDIVQIGSYAFEHCGALTKLTLPDSLEEIGGGTFDYCEELLSISIPEQVETIPGDTFRNCHRLEKVILSSKTKKIGASSFEYCFSLKSIDIPSSVETIGEFAFYGCSRLSSINLPNIPIEIGWYAFGDTEYYNHSNNWDDGVLYIGRHLYEAREDLSGCYEVKEGTITIANYAFYSCDNLSEIIVGDDVKTIGEEAFYSCSNLTNLVLGKNVTHIYANAFKYCKSLTTVTICDKLVDIHNSSFDECSVKELIVAEGTEHIDSEMIVCKYTLEKVLLPDGLLSIGERAFNWASMLRSINIPDSVISIGNHAFDGCDNLSDVSISAKNIGDFAFNSCDNLSGVTIGENLETIGMYAFQNCTNLNEVHIESMEAWCKIDFYDEKANPAYYAKNVYLNGKDICEVIVPFGISKLAYTFCNFTSLENVIVPNSVTDIGAYTFYNCSNLENIIVPMGVTNIDYNAFSNCSNLKSITIPDTVANIGTYAFLGCDKLTDVYFVGTEEQWDKITVNSGNGPLSSATIHYNSICEHEMLEWVVRTPNTCTKNGEKYRACSICGETDTEIIPAIGHAFNTVINSATCTEDGNITNSCVNCGKTETERISAVGHEYNSTITTPTCTQDGEEHKVCSVCGTEETIRINALGHNYTPEWTVDVAPTETTEGSKSRHCTRCDSTTDVVTIPMLDTSVEDFEYSISDGEVTILKYVGTSENVEIPKIIEGYPVTIINWNAFYECETLYSVIIPTTVKIIETLAFSDCTSLTSIVIPESVTYLGDMAFNSCTSLQSVEIQGKLTNTGFATFSNCTSLTSVTLSEGVLEIGESVFSNCSSLTNIVIPEGVTKIGEYAFADCTSLSSITLPASLESIGEYAFICHSSNSNITEVYISDILSWCNVEFCGNDANPLSARFGGAELYLNGLRVEKLEIPEGVTRIGDYVFYGCTSIESVTIPNSLTSIGALAFSGCGNLSEVYINNMQTWYNIDFQCNPMCNGADLYLNDVKVTDVVIPEDMTKIPDSVFDGCTSLTNVVIPDSVISIGDGSFCGCINLTDIIIPDGIKSIGAGAFSGCTNLTDVVIPNGVTRIEDSTFSYCSNLKSIIIPEGVNHVGNFAFGYCGKLTNIDIPEEVTFIGIGAFSNCTSLLNIVIPHNVKILEFNVFGECTSLKNIFISEGITEIGQGAFYGCTSLVNVVVPEGVTCLGFEAFSGCSNLESVVLPKSITALYDWVFEGCDNLETVYYVGSELEWNAVEKINDEFEGIEIIYNYVSFVSNDVKIEATINEIDSDVELIVNIIAEDSIIEEVITNISGKYLVADCVLYDISLVKDSQKVQPGGEVTLSLPVPEHMSYEDCKVVYIDSNGNVTDMNAVYEDGYMVFATDHFSYYALVEETDLLVGDVNSDGIVDNLDRMTLSRYLADWAEYTEDVINTEAADVNKDGVVDNLDRMVLSRHLADWEGYEVLPYTE